MSQPQLKPSLYDRVRPWVPLLVFIFAFGYRLIGIGWGLKNDLHNQSYHPDEQVIFSWSQAVDPAHGNFTPGFYNYGTLYLTLLRVSSDMVKTYSGAPDPKDPQSRWEFMAKCNLVGRVISSLAGALTAVIVYLMLRRFSRPFGALLGALAIAVAPAFVVHSRFLTVDVTATMLLAASLYFTTLLLPATGSHEDPPNWVGRLIRYAALAGLFAGLSAGTKYTGILAILPLIIGCFLAPRPSTEPKKGGRFQVKLIVASLLGAFVGFFVGTPGYFLDHARFQASLAFEAQHVATGHGLVFTDVASGFLYHIMNLMAGVGPFLLLMCGIGLLIGLIQKQKWLWLLLAFSLPYYLLIGSEKVLFLRYTFPLYVIAAAAFGWWMGYAHTLKGKHLFPTLAGILFLGLSAMVSANMTAWMAGLDPRDQVALELKGIQYTKSMPPTTVGSVSDPWYYSPPLIPDSTMMRGPHTEERQLAEMAVSHDPKFVQFVPSNINERFDWDTRLITDARPDYIVYSSFEQYDVDRLQDAKNLDAIPQLMVNRYKDFQKLLVQQYVHFNRNEPDPYVRIEDLEYIRPYLWIWKRKDLP